MNESIPEIHPDIAISYFDEQENKSRYLLQLMHLNYVINYQLKCVIDRIVAYHNNEKIETNSEVDKLSIYEVAEIAKEYLPEQVFTNAKIEKTRPPFIISTKLIGSKHLTKITSKLTFLFNKQLMIMCLLLFIVLHFLALPTAFNTKFSYIPEQQYIYFVVLFFLSFIIHEIGHATACKRFGQNHGAIGIGIYFIFPVFYADVTNAWKFKRKERAVVDIGGLYFQAILLSFIDLFVLHNGSPLASNLVWFITFTMLHTLNPFFKFDGYWLLSDLSGITNLHDKVKNVLFSYSRAILGGEKFGVYTKKERFILIPYSFLSLLFAVYFITFLFNQLAKYKNSIPIQFSQWYQNTLLISEWIEYFDCMFNLVLIFGMPILLIIGVVFYLKKMFDFFF